MHHEIPLLTNMCRLCSSGKNLVWVFDKRFENTDSIKYAIFVTTGVQVHTTDAISQKICENCCRTIITMFEFRKQSLKNDKYLKEQLKKLRKDGSFLEVEVKEEKVDGSKRLEEGDEKCFLNIHPTIRELYYCHPHLKLPNLCLNLNVKPSIVMKKNEVEDYFKLRQLNFEDHCKLAVKYSSTARKKTLSSPLTLKSNNLKPNFCSINGQIMVHKDANIENNIVHPIKIDIMPKMPVQNDIRQKTKEYKLSQTVQCHNNNLYLEKKLSDNEIDTQKNRDQQDTKVQHGIKTLLNVTSIPISLPRCNICGTIYHCTTDLKKHRYRHLCCPYCRITFRNVRRKIEHVEKHCLVKEAMNNFPCVELPKIESNIDIVNKYRKVFRKYFISTSNKAPDGDVVLLSSDSEEFSSSNLEKEVPDVIEIVSDDDNTWLIPASLIDKSTVASPIEPDVTINGNPTLNSHLSLTIEKGIQTEGPSTGIETDEKSLTAIFKNLKQHLHVFRIPVEISNGPFDVRYKCSTEEVKSKNLHWWNDLTPVDISYTRNRTTDSTADNEQTYNDLRICLQEKLNTTAEQDLKEQKLAIEEEAPENIPPGSTSSVIVNDTSASSLTDPVAAVSSTHEHMFVVGPSAIPTFSSGKSTKTLLVADKQQIINSTSSSIPSDVDCISKKTRISPPLQTTTVESAPCDDIVDSALKKLLQCSPLQMTDTYNALDQSARGCDDVVDSILESKQTSSVNQDVSISPAPCHAVADSTLKQLLLCSPLQLENTVDSADQSTGYNDAVESVLKSIKIFSSHPNANKVYTPSDELELPLVDNNVNEYEPNRKRRASPLQVVNKEADCRIYCADQSSAPAPKKMRMSPLPLPPAVSSTIHDTFYDNNSMLSNPSIPKSHSTSCSSKQNTPFISTTHSHSTIPTPTDIVSPSAPSHKPVTFKIPPRRPILNTCPSFKDTECNSPNIPCSTPFQVQKHWFRPTPPIINKQSSSYSSTHNGHGTYVSTNNYIKENQCPATCEAALRPPAYSVGYSNVITNAQVQFASKNSQSINGNSRRLSLPNPPPSQELEISQHIENVIQQTFTNSYMSTRNEAQNYSGTKLHNRRYSVPSQHPYQRPVQPPSYPGTGVYNNTPPPIQENGYNNAIYSKSSKIINENNNCCYKPSVSNSTTTKMPNTSNGYQMSQTFHNSEYSNPSQDLPNANNNYYQPNEMFVSMNKLINTIDSNGSPTYLLQTSQGCQSAYSTTSPTINVNNHYSNSNDWNFNGSACIPQANSTTTLGSCSAGNMVATHQLGPIRVKTLSELS